MNREFSVQKRNSVWCGDITCIPTWEGWPCLATRLDLFSRKIVGWQVSSRINENLVIDALDNAVNRENPRGGLMVHADRGSQYTSSRFCRELEDRGFVQSFSRKGCPCDNAVMESFFKTLKRELPLDRKYETRIEARQEIFKFSELHCNTRRPHSSLGNLSPVEYERQCAH
ncbi:IS3 family transposase [uncultured Slackia sp.]|uniref:IS3 family transposase n=1 Tax=uncultured Slackia sp. TaxID=665903 RepID=UPI0025E7EC22|nr:IS3 family transposase [uncultured Slackia sp.]